jgi:hypothetical protein
MRRIMPVMTLTPFATSRSAAGRCLDVVLGTTHAPTGSYVDRSRADRSSHTMRPDGGQVVVSAFNAGAQHEDATRDAPALSMAQLREIALDTRWDALG